MINILRFVSILLLSLLYFHWVQSSEATYYYFQDEFNQERPANNIDTNSWTAYPNALATTILESGGNLSLSTGSEKQFPYIVSKNNPFPISGNFILEFGIQYTSVKIRGDGFVISLIKPQNGISELDKDKPEVNFFGVWQGNDDGFKLMYNGYCAVGLSCQQPGTTILHTPAPNLSYHRIKLIYSNQIYSVYFDGNKIFTSPTNSTRPAAIWMGNPTSQGFGDFWTSFKIDYTRISSLPVPFLELPWDYQSKGLSFDEAALNIYSFFDHQYPLLSSGLAEPVNNNNTVIPFFMNTPLSNLPYSSHDGYDFSRADGIRLDDNVLAAAPGTATFINNCSACGNMILIDHHNGYQTRYMHLKPDGLITNIPSQSVEVTNRQVIGKVGLTGNTTGAHIHFDVYQDKNGDGNFSNDIPDGATDPYGWQSADDDPWPIFVSGSHSGNFSNYLWKDVLGGIDQTLTSNGGTYQLSHHSVNIPVNAVNQNTYLNIRLLPNIKLANNLVSLGSTLSINATNLAGNLVHQFSQPFLITTDFSSVNLSRFNPATISFYSSEDGVNWTQETTSVNLINKTASALINHLSYFSLMGQRADITPPVTSVSLGGTIGQPNWFRTNVTANLNALDDILGVDYSAYKLDSSDWQAYQSPIVVSSEGHHRLDYYSVDNDDNAENIKSIEFDIDKTAPEVRFYIDKITKQVITEQVDTNPSNSATDLTNGPLNPKYILTDKAGNVLTVNSTLQNIGNIWSIKINSLQYNNSPVQNPVDNKLSGMVRGQAGSLVDWEQLFTKNNKPVTRLSYDSRRNITTIFETVGTKEKVKSTRKGYSLLKISTSNSSLVPIY